MPLLGYVRFERVFVTTLNACAISLPGIQSGPPSRPSTLPLVGRVLLPLPNTHVDLLFPLPELHQLTSPPTAPAFLDSLFESASDVENALSEAEIFAQYIAKSWVAIVKSSM